MDLGLNPLNQVNENFKLLYRDYPQDYFTSS